jgi:hypothetical protein
LGSAHPSEGGGGVADADADPGADADAGMRMPLCANVRETANFLKLR